MDFQIVKMNKDKISTKMSKIFVRIIATGPCIANQLRDEGLLFNANFAIFQQYHYF
jgi:hypothetical protein